MDELTPDERMPDESMPDESTPDGDGPGDGLPDEQPDAQSDESSDQIDYDVAEWSGQSRSLLDSLLTSEGVAHVWQGTLLTIGGEDEALVDSLIDLVTATATEGLDTDRPQVLYEVGAWSAALQTSLAQAMDVAEIPFEWDENGDLKVYEDDEDQVDEILDSMPDPDDPDALDADGLDAQAVLSMLWEAVGVLAKRPRDPDAVLGAISSGARMERMNLPFGFESSVWRDIVAKASRLREALESDDAELQLSDDEIREGCEDLRQQLRHYI